jgi:large subunit ribosomal protein L4
VKCHEHKTVLVATAVHDTNLHKSVRNIAGVSLSPVAELNALIVLKPRRLLFTKAALEWVKEQAGKSSKEKSGESAEKSEGAKPAAKRTVSAAKRKTKKKES